jgi:hypothetical protein
MRVTLLMSKILAGAASRHSAALRYSVIATLLHNLKQVIWQAQPFNSYTLFDFYSALKSIK